MRFAVTGAGGFLGRRVVAMLASRGHSIAVIARTPIAPPGAATASMDWYGCGMPGVAQAIAEADAAIHLATDYGRSSAAVDQVVEANIALPLRLAHLAASRGVPVLLADTFFAKPGVKYGHLMLYAESKRACRQMAWSIMSGRAAMCVLFLEHVYGPGDSLAKAIPQLASRIVAGEGRLALTRGEQRRDFIHVDDAAAAIVQVAEQTPGMPTVQPQHFEIGSGQAMSLRCFLELIHHAAGSSVVLGWGDLPDRTGEPESTGADTGQLRALGWRASVSPQEGAASIVGWLRGLTRAGR